MPKQQNNKTVFEQIYKEYYKEIYSYLYFYLRNKADTEDVLQDTFVKVFNNIDKLKEGEVRPWIYRIAKNTFLDRAKSYEYSKVKKDSEFMDNLIQDNRIEDDIDKKDLFENVVKRLDELNADQKEAIVLRFIEDLEYEEISQIMGKSVEAVRVLVSRGLQQLRLDSKEDKKKLLALNFMFTPLFMLDGYERIFVNLNSKILNVSNAIMETTNEVSKTMLYAKIAGVVGIGALVVGGAIVTVGAVSNNSKKVVEAPVTPTVSTTVSPKVVATPAPTGTPAGTIVPTQGPAAKTEPSAPAQPAVNTYTYKDIYAEINYPEGWKASTIYTVATERAPIGVKFEKGKYILYFDYKTNLTTGAGYGFWGDSTSDGQQCKSTYVNYQESNGKPFKPKISDGKDLANFAAPTKYIQSGSCGIFPSSIGELWGGSMVAIDHNKLFNVPSDDESYNFYIGVYYQYKNVAWGSFSMIHDSPDEGKDLPVKGSADLIKNLTEMDSILYSAKFDKGIMYVF